MWGQFCTLTPLPLYDGDEAIYTYHRLDSDLESTDIEIIV